MNFMTFFQNRRRIMFSDGAKDIVANSMHARIPNCFIKRDQWINLCLDLQSFTKECFSKPSNPPTRTRSREVESRSKVQKTAQKGQQNNSMKHLEQIQLEGNFKLKKIFSTRNQIHIDASDDELRDMIPHDKNLKTEPINAKLDFN